MRLLPRDRSVGWIPYLWLVYLFGLPWNLLYQKAGPIRWALTLAGMAAFLVLYFRAYHVRGRSRFLMVAGIVLLGVLFAPVNPGASVYFIYASAFIGMVAETRFMVRALAAMLALLGAETILFRLPPYFWIPGAFFSIMIAVINAYYTQRQRDQKRLLIAHEEVERMAKVAERERIARDLHDVLGHTLSLIVLKSELASKLAEADPPAAVREIRDVERISREALAQVRATVRGYQTMSLQAEAAQARAALEAAGVNVDCDVEPGSLPPSHEGVMALVLREAVTNVIRHAHAKHCRVRMRRAEGVCRLEVEDDGCGRDAPEGVGLTGMRRRVEALGGSLLREARAAAGTRLTIVLPVAAP